jgi:hypothetical protein
MVTQISMEGRLDFDITGILLRTGLAHPDRSIGLKLFVLYLPNGRYKTNRCEDTLREPGNNPGNYSMR